MWDYRISRSGMDLKELVMKSSKGELPKQVEQQLVEELKLSPELALEWSPESVPCLVENHNNLALEILSSVHKTPRGPEYFQELYKAKLSARQANFIVKLNDRVGGLNVPTLFNYIKTSIDECIMMSTAPKEDVMNLLNPVERG